jgi:glycosyltransferase involved in cell wall biosynthesis
VRSTNSQISSDLAFELAGVGNDVHVIRCDDPQARLPAAADVQGVHIHRVSSTEFGRGALLGRSVDYGSFYASMWRAMNELAGPNSILITKTDPPLTAMPAMLTRRRGAKLINWLQDIYPEVAIELGVPLVSGTIGRGLCRLRDASLKAAVRNVVVGQLMAERLYKCGVPNDKVEVIANWCDDESIVPITQHENALRKEWGLMDSFVVGYSGNLGRAHEFETVLGAASQLKDQRRIVFLMIGGGHQFDQLAQTVKSRRLEQTYRFVPYQDHTLLKYSLSVPDVHWLSLKPKLEGLIVQSKFYGIAAAGRPVIAITAADGEIARLVSQNDCGRVIAPGDVNALTETVIELSEKPSLVAEMGRRARSMLDAQFTRMQALGRWRRLVDSIW